MSQYDIQDYRTERTGFALLKLQHSPVSTFFAGMGFINLGEDESG